MGRGLHGKKKTKDNATQLLVNSTDSNKIYQIDPKPKEMINEIANFTISVGTGSS
jgi:hypothetical protein